MPSFLYRLRRQLAPRLFVPGPVQLRSGAWSTWKIECDALAPAEWQALARIARRRVPPYRAVEGVPRGGLPFATALRWFATGNPADALLLVDDVYTTGGALEAHRAGRAAIGLVVFARAPITQPWIRALFPLAPPWDGDGS